MLVNTQQIQLGVVEYIESEIASKAVGFNKFAIYFILPKVSTKVKELINEYKDNTMSKDFFDENGNVNLDEVYNAAKNAISKSGQFTLYGIIFNETDIDKLYTYIKNITI